MLEFRNKLMGMNLQDELYSSSEPISIDDDDIDGLNVEGSHETVSNGGVQGPQDVEAKLQDEFYSSDEDENDDDDDDSDAEYQKKDPVQKYKFDYVKSSVLLDNFPELDIDRDKNPAAIKSTVVAPGEGKIPTNIVTEKDWDIKGFPGLHPDGKCGLDAERVVDLTKQKYFEQRIMNEDLRFANNPDYIFAAFACCERERLDNNVGISFRRGRPSANGKHTLDDPFSVLDNIPGTPKYWQKRKWEMIARLENLGAFQLFFTLSCAEKRWNENFTAFLQDHDITYEVINGLEKCFVSEKGGIPRSLDDFLAEKQNLNKFEFIRQNVLSATLHFDHRVNEFFKHIVLSKKSKMPVQYYNYRVEFQMRGAGHIHGVLWLDLDHLSKLKKDNDPEMREAMDDNEIDVDDPNCDPGQLAKIFDRLKNDEVGIPHGNCCHESSNVESSHETVSSGGVQGLQNVESSHETVSSGGVQGHQNVESSHETVSTRVVVGFRDSNLYLFKSTTDLNNICSVAAGSCFWAVSNVALVFVWYFQKF